MASLPRYTQMDDLARAGFPSPSCQSIKGSWHLAFLTIPSAILCCSAKSRQSCPTLCDPIDGSPPGSSIHGILQSRRLEWAAVFFSLRPHGSNYKRNANEKHNEGCQSWTIKKAAAAAAAAKSLQSCPTLCDPIDGSPAGSPVPGILQARTLEWVAISFSDA